MMMMMMIMVMMMMMMMMIEMKVVMMKKVLKYKLEKSARPSDLVEPIPTGRHNGRNSRIADIPSK